MATRPIGDSRPQSVASCAALADWAASQCSAREDTVGDECEQTEAQTLAACEELASTGNAVHFVTIDPDGSLAPNPLTIADGDTVIWSFDQRGEAIIPVEPATPVPTPSASTVPPVCLAYRPYEPDDPNEFTGPMRRAVSGVFILNRQRDAGSETLLEAFDPALADSAANGVSIRIKWSDVHLGPGSFDWTWLDSQVRQIVDAGKLFNVVVKAGRDCDGADSPDTWCGGTPEWIFDADATLGAPVEALELRDAGSFPPAGSCGNRMTLGSPTDANYRRHYFDMLEALAAHLKEKNLWYQSLGYVKPSGANLHSPEARLPRRCWSSLDGGLTSERCDCEEPTAARPAETLERPCVCNPRVWSVEGGYTPEGLYQFFSLQNALLARAFPEKDLSFMLIQGGWPWINDAGEYDGQDLVDADGSYLPAPDPARAPLFELTRAITQTEELLARGAAEHGARFVVQHNAMRGPGSANTLVVAMRDVGQITGYQTSNDLSQALDGFLPPPELPVGGPSPGPVGPTLSLLGASLAAAVAEEAVFLEVYQADLLVDGTPRTTFDGRSLEHWVNDFHRVRRKDEYWQLAGDPFPYLHGHTFRWHADGSTLDAATRRLDRARRQPGDRRLRRRQRLGLSPQAELYGEPLVLRYVVMPHCRANDVVGEIIVLPPG